MVSWKYIAGVGLIAAAILAGVVGYLVLTPKENVESISLVLAWVPQGRDGGLYLAIDKGFYAEEGLALSVIAGKGSAFATEQVSTRNAEFGFVTTSPIIQYRAQGAKVKICMGLEEKDAIGIAYRTDMCNLTVPKDMEGKRFITSAFDTSRFAMPVWLNMNNASYSKVIEVIMDSTVMVSSFMRGDADTNTAAFNSFWVTIEATAKQQGVPVKFMFYSDFGWNSYGFLICTNENLIKEKPDLVRRFVRATLKGYRYMIDHPQEALDAILKYQPSLDRNITKTQIERTLDLLPPVQNLGLINSTKMQSTISLYSSAYNITVPISPADVFTNEFVSP